MANIKLPLNILVLTGKSCSDPESTFNQIVTYQIRDSLNGLPEFAWTYKGQQPTQPPQNIYEQIYDYFPLFQQGIGAFLILFPSFGELKDADQELLRWLFQYLGDSLLDQTYFIISGPKMTDIKLYRQFTMKIIHFLADNDVLRGDEQWTHLKQRFVCIGDLEPKQMIQLAMHSLRTYGCLDVRNIAMGAKKFLTSPGPTAAPLFHLRLNDNCEVLEVCKRVTSLPALLQYEDFLKYFATKKQGMSYFLDSLYDQIFSDPNYIPIRSFSADFSELLREMKQLVLSPPEHNQLEVIECKHNQRLWQTTGFNSITNTELGHSYFISIQYRRIREFLAAFHVGFTGVPNVTCEGNVRLYQAKPELHNIGHCIEIADPAEITDNFKAEEWMARLRFLDSGRPCFLYVNEANVDTYRRILHFILLNNVPVRCLTIQSETSSSLYQNWSNVIEISRYLFERPNDQTFKEFYYFANHKAHENFELKTVLDVLKPCLNRLECLGIQFFDFFPPKFFANLFQWPNLPNLRQLQLRWVKIPASGVAVLVSGFDSFPNLEVLNLMHSEIDVVQHPSEIPGSYLLAQNLYKLPNLRWLSLHGNKLSQNSVRLLVDAIAEYLQNMEHVLFSENKTDGPTIEYCLAKLRFLPKLRQLDFMYPFHEFSNLADKKALKWHILRPFQVGNVFPQLRQLRFVGISYQLNAKINDDPERENIEQSIKHQIKLYNSQCSIEF